MAAVKTLYMHNCQANCFSKRMLRYTDSLDLLPKFGEITIATLILEKGQSFFHFRANYNSVIVPYML